MKKRILSLLLAFSMAATLAPATALVGGSTAEAALTSATVTWPSAVGKAAVSGDNVYILKKDGAGADTDYDISVTPGQADAGRIGYVSEDQDIVADSALVPTTDVTTKKVELVGKKIGSTSVTVVANNGTPTSLSKAGNVITADAVKKVTVLEKPDVEVERVSSSQAIKGGDGSPATPYLLVPGTPYTFSFYDKKENIVNVEYSALNNKTGDGITVTSVDDVFVAKKSLPKGQKASFTVELGAGKDTNIALTAATTGLALTTTETVYFEAYASSLTHTQNNGVGPTTAGVTNIAKGGSGTVTITTAAGTGPVSVRNNGGVSVGQVVESPANTFTFPITVSSTASGNYTDVVFQNNNGELITIRVNFTALRDVLTLLGDDDFAQNATVTDNGTVNGTGAYANPGNLNDDNATILVSGNTAQFEVMHTVLENVPGITTKYEWQSTALKGVVGVEIVPGTRTVGVQRVDLVKLTNLDKASLVEGHSYKLTLTSWNGNNKVSNDLVINFQTINKDSEVTFNAGVGGSTTAARVAAVQAGYTTGVWTMIDSANVKQALKVTNDDPNFPYYAAIGDAANLFTRPGYTLVGWYDETNKVSYDTNGDFLTGANTGNRANLHPPKNTGAKLVAQWEETRINVIYHPNRTQINNDFNQSLTPDVALGGTAISTAATASSASYHLNMRINQSVDKYGSSQLNPLYTGTQGFEIIGWTTVPGGNRVELKDGAPITASLISKARALYTHVTGTDNLAVGNELVLYAVWQPITYEIIFDANRRGYTAEPYDAAVASIKKTFGTDLRNSQWPENTFRTAQRGFLGWNTSFDGRGVWVIPNDAAAGANQTYTGYANAVAGIFNTTGVTDAELGNTGGQDRDGDGNNDNVTRELTLYAIWKDGYNVVCYSEPYSATATNKIFTTFSVPFPAGTNRTNNAANQLLPVGDVVAGWTVTRWQTASGIQAEKYTVNSAGEIVYTGLQDEVNLYPDATARVAIAYTASFDIPAGTSSNDSANRPFYVSDTDPIKLPKVTSTTPDAYTFMGWVYRGSTNHTAYAANGVYAGVDVPATATSISIADGMAHADGTNEVRLVGVALPNAMMADLDGTNHNLLYNNGMNVATGVPYRFDVPYGTSLESIKANLNNIAVLIPEAGVTRGDTSASLTPVWDNRAADQQINKLGKNQVKLIKSITWTGDYNAAKPGTYTLTGTITPNEKVVGNADKKQTITVKITVAAPTADNVDKVTAINLGEYVITVPAGTNYAEIQALIEAERWISVTNDTGRSYTRTAVRDNNNSLLGNATRDGYWRPILNGGTLQQAFAAQGAGSTNKPASGAYVFYSADATTTGNGQFVENTTALGGAADVIYYPVGSVAKLVVIVGDAEYENVARVTSISPIANVIVDKGTLLSAIKAKVDTSAVINLSDGTTARGPITWDWSELSDYTEESPEGYSKTITGTVSNTTVIWGSVEPKVTCTITVGKQPEKVASTLAEAQKLLDQKYLLRFFNKVTGEHLYTTDITEYVSLVTNKNWVHETYVSGNNTFKGSVERTSVYDTLVFRLFSAANREHLYTSDLNEVTVLQNKGWKLDTTRFYVSQDKTGTPYYRQVRNILINGKPALQHHLCIKEEFDANNASGKGWRADNEGKPFWYSPAN